MISKSSVLEISCIIFGNVLLFLFISFLLFLPKLLFVGCWRFGVAILIFLPFLKYILPSLHLFVLFPEISSSSNFYWILKFLLQYFSSLVELCYFQFILYFKSNILLVLHVFIVSKNLFGASMINLKKFIFIIHFLCFYVFLFHFSCLLLVIVSEASSTIWWPHIVHPCLKGR